MRFYSCRWSMTILTMVSGTRYVMRKDIVLKLGQPNYQALIKLWNSNLPSFIVIRVPHIKHETLNQYCPNASPPCATLHQHKICMSWGRGACWASHESVNRSRHQRASITHREKTCCIKSQAQGTINLFCHLQQRYGNLILSSSTVSSIPRHTQATGTATRFT